MAHDNNVNEDCLGDCVSVDPSNKKIIRQKQQKQE